ncbi:hypothetical protein [Pseudocnuella soli]|nr:hypothetical protein [Pseudocnuella soli]
MMLFIIVLILFLVGLGTFMVFAAKKEKGHGSLSDPNAGTQRGPQ